MRPQIKFIYDSWVIRNNKFILHKTIDIITMSIEHVIKLANINAIHESQCFF